jgi:amidase
MERVSAFFGDGPKPGASGEQIHATVLKLKQYQIEYLEYWNDSVKRTKMGRPVDAVICPVAPMPSFELGKSASVCMLSH